MKLKPVSKISHNDYFADHFIIRLSGIWIALQRYSVDPNKVGPFGITIYEALQNEVMEIFVDESVDQVIKFIRETSTIERVP